MKPASKVLRAQTGYFLQTAKQPLAMVDYYRKPSGGWCSLCGLTYAACVRVDAPSGNYAIFCRRCVKQLAATLVAP